MPKQQYVYPHRYFHITQSNLGKNVIMKPSGNYEPKGVSFSPTIRGCLEGVPFYYTDANDWHTRKDFVKEWDIWFVYTPAHKRIAIIPDSCDDLERTRERRVPHKTSCNLVGVIKVNCNNNRWDYKWISKFK
jgi:hypothetical protein